MKTREKYVVRKNIQEKKKDCNIKPRVVKSHCTFVNMVSSHFVFSSNVWFSFQFPILSLFVNDQ